MHSLKFSRSLQILCIVWWIAVLSGIESPAATRTWDGGGTDNNWMTATNWAGDVAPAAGDSLVFPLGAMRQNNDNNFPAGTTFSSIFLSGANYSLNGSSLALDAGITVAQSVANNTIFLPLTLNSNQTITVSNVSFSAALNLRGPIDLGANTLTFAGPGSFQVQAVISGAGGLRKFGVGTALLYATNTYSGPLEVLEGGATFYRPQALGTTNGATMVATGASLAIGSSGAPQVIAEPLNLAGTVGGVSVSSRWVGPVILIVSNATVNVNSGNSPLVVDGLVSGGGLDKAGDGTLTLNANNTYTNRTRIAGGVLRVNGLQPQSAITLEGGTLGGTGAVGTVTASGVFAKSLAPGGSPGVLSCSNVILSSLTTFQVELNGMPPGSGYDQLNVTGGVALSNAVLSATLGFPSIISNAFTIIQNDGTDAVTNTFNGAPEGATVNISGTPFRITYAGGTGNDVVLTQLAPAPQPTLTIRRSPPANVVISWATNFPGYTMEANTNLSTTNWVVVSPAPGVSGTNNVLTNAASGLEKYYRLRAP